MSSSPNRSHSARVSLEPRQMVLRDGGSEIYLEADEDLVVRVKNPIGQAYDAEDGMVLIVLSVDDDCDEVRVQPSVNPRQQGMLAVLHEAAYVIQQSVAAL